MEFTIPENLWIYIIGAIGYLVYIRSSYCKERSHLLSFEIIGGVLVASQWVLLGQVVPAAMNLAFSYVAFLGLYVGRFGSIKYLYPLVFPFCIGTVFLYGTGSIIDTLALSASLPGLCARYFRNIYILRYLSVFGALSWLTINLSSGVIVGGVCNILYMSGHVVNLARHYQRKEEQKEDWDEEIKELSPAQ